MNRSILSVVLFLAIVTIASCQNGCDKLPAIEPPQPAGSATIPPIEESSFQIPVTIELEQFRQQINAAVPKTISEDDGRDCNEYGVYKRDPVAISVNGNIVQTRIGIEYRLKVYGVNEKPLCTAGASCGYGERAPRSDIIPITTLTWNSNWRLDSRTELRIDMLDACNLTAANIDARNKVKKVMESTNALKRIPGLIDEQVQQKAHVRPQAERAWAALQQPINLADNVWLVVNPKAVRVSAINGSGSQITTSVGLVGTPEVRFTNAVPASTNTAFPALETTPASAGFHIAIDGHLTYDSATKLASQALIIRRYPFPGDHHITIRNVRIYGSGAKAIVELSFDGSAKGTVYLSGTPTFMSVTADGERDVVTIDDLDYTLETRNVLAKTADWLLHEDFLKSLRAAAKYPLDDKIPDLRERLNAGLARELAPNIRMRGQVNQVTVRGVYLDSTQMVIRAVADGMVSIAAQ